MGETTNKAYAKVYTSGNCQVISIKKDTLEKPNIFKDRWRKFIENDGKYERGEYDWGGSVGREEW
ncbi:hypothetical protein [Mammaliicoccus vitulinus]|uniref:hypothetical protein n=1 Tax=Mammaliicoccus vitulinus TaxID=71237 RepID=UPI0002F080AA|nr:hypothetical protein [Mammaliicoccus vitulinus]